MLKIIQLIPGLWTFSSDFLKLTTYLTFFTIVMTYFGLPLNIIRDVYMTGVSFYTRFRDLLRYRAATKDMETKYPDATEAELAVMSDRTCIICREDMSSNAPRIHAQPPEVALGPNGLPQPGQTLGLRDPPKKLPCGHVFHFQCLRSWLERQQSCPTCRRSVLEPANPNGGTNAATAEAQQRQQQQQGPGLAPPPAPGAVPQPPGQAAPIGAPAAQPLPIATGARTRNGAHPTARSRSPAGAVAPRAFQGFSVGGEWHAWQAPNLDTDAGSVSPVAESSRSAAASRVTHPEDDATSAGTATPTVVGTATGSPSESAVATAAEPSPVEGAAQAKDPGPLPQEAAAAAALRRLNGVASSFKKSTTSVTKSVTALTPTGSEPQHQQSRPTPTPTRPTPLLPPISSASTSTSANSTSESFSSQPSTSSTAELSTSNALPPPSKPTSLPTLIPLFDPSSVANRPFINLSNISLGFDLTATGPLTGGATTPGGLLPRARTYSTSSLSAFAQTNSSSFPWSASANTGGLARTPAGSISSTPIRVSSTTSLTSLHPSASNPLPLSLSPPQPLPHPSRTSSSYFADLPEAAAGPPLQIPNVLMDEVQLRRVDAWTRDAIDERLRVLEDVQRSLWHAAAELQRVRSTLPPTPTSTANQQASPVISSASAKGKGRAVFDVQEEDEGDDLISPSAPTDSAINGGTGETVVEPPFP